MNPRTRSALCATGWFLAVVFAGMYVTTLLAVRAGTI